jgi:HK97 family phage portal protein
VRSALARRTAAPVTNNSPVPMSPRTSGQAFAFSDLFGAGDTYTLEQQLDVLEESSTLMGIAGRKCSAQAQVEWHLYRKSPDGDPEKRVKDTTHWAWSLWSKPNHVETGMEFREPGAQHLMLTGERYWVLGYHPSMRGVPYEMWTARPDRMAPVRDPYRVLIGWVYKGFDGEDIPLKLNEVIQTKIPHPKDPLRGLAPIKALRTNIASVRASEQWNANFFINGAEPGGVVQFEEPLTQQEWNQFVERWTEMHRGVSKAHRISVVEAGTYTPFFNHRDMEFPTMQDKGRDRQLEAYGMPRSMLGITEDVNRANAEAAEYMFSKWVNGTDLKRDRDVLNNKLLPLFGPLVAEGWEFDFEDPTPDDGEAKDRERTSKATAFKTLIDSGADPKWAARESDYPDDVKMREGALENRDNPPQPALPPGQGQKALPAGGSKRNEPTEPQDALADFGSWLAGVVNGNGRCSHGHRVRNAVEPQPEDDPDAADEVDLAPVLEATTAAIAALLTEWTAEIVPEWITSLIEQISAILKSGRRKDLFELEVPLTDATKLVTDAMVSRANLAAEEVVQEGLAQDVSLDAKVPTRTQLQENADATVRLLADQIEATAARSANRRASPDTPDDAVIEGVRADLEALSEATPKRQLGGAIHTAVGHARKRTMLGQGSGGPVGALYASEQMDSRTCEPCDQVHGRWIGNINPGDPSDLPEVDLLYPAGFYINCEGWENCRGTIVGVWRPKTTDARKGRK